MALHCTAERECQMNDMHETISQVRITASCMDFYIVTDFMLTSLTWQEECLAWGVQKSVNLQRGVTGGERWSVG